FRQLPCLVNHADRSVYFSAVGVPEVCSSPPTTLLPSTSVALAVRRRTKPRCYPSTTWRTHEIIPCLLSPFTSPPFFRQVSLACGTLVSIYLRVRRKLVLSRQRHL
ncbi:unnamed protein product, partial [Ectocarpus sp. 6 AP-2014]